MGGECGLRPTTLNSVDLIFLNLLNLERKSREYDWKYDRVRGILIKIEMDKKNQIIWRFLNPTQSCCGSATLILSAKTVKQIQNTIFAGRINLMISKLPLQGKYHCNIPMKSSLHFHGKKKINGLLTIKILGNHKKNWANLA